MTDKPVLILGAGGHAKVLAGSLLRSGRRIHGFLDPANERHGSQLLGLRILGGDDLLKDHAPDAVELVNGLGSVGDMAPRRRLYERYRAEGYHFAVLCDAAAFIAQDVVLGEGAQVMAGALVQIGAQIAENAIINTGAIVEHDCRIGPHCHIAPGAVLSGGVTVGANVHIGTGATVIQGVTLGNGCLVAAGAVVTENLASGSRAFGVPARPQ